MSIAYVLLLDDNDSEEESINYRNERRFLRNRYNVLQIPNKKFKQSFRISKEIFKYLLDELSSEPEFNITGTSRITKVSLQTKLAAVLNFYATGSYQRTIGDVMLHSLNQSMISTSINSITNVLERKLCHKWIKFPDEAKKAEYKLKFYEKTGFPGVFGCVDGTHVEIITPAENEHLFVDRRGNHSLNVQLICNYDLKILAVNARYPGSTHDAAIWATSAERRKLVNDHDNGSRNSWLLGDSGYPLEKWIITPFKNPTNENQRRFNHLHSQSRNPIERCNGALKTIFRCLLGERVLRYEPTKVIKIINVCCALLNMCLDFDSNFIEDLNIDFDQIITSNDNFIDEEESELDDEDAIQIRQNLSDSLT